MDETNSTNNSLREYFDEEWLKLSSEEKSIAKNYARLLMADRKPTNEMIIKMNEIHDKYPDFHVGCVP